VRLPGQPNFSLESVRCMALTDKCIQLYCWMIKQALCSNSRLDLSICGEPANGKLLDFRIHVPLRAHSS